MKYTILLALFGAVIYTATYFVAFDPPRCVPGAVEVVFYGCRQ
jgi:hypothetical protein